MDPEAVRDVFRKVGPVGIRRMFGGQGIYRGEAMFALVAGGELYLKADGETEEMFRRLGSRPFSFERRDGRVTQTSYWLMPESALDDPDEAAELAGMALQAALRAGAARTQGRAKAPPRRKAGKPLPESAT
ncbi:MAG TPA: TfoX/Sxy family protein [Microvirga sp.]|jgi:DNA transformation protein|nr:TfoX/Sxy family protein [Microvirga sp.]